jgi:urease accessory protein
VAVFLARGGVLRASDRLVAECGLAVEIGAATETLSEARTDDPDLFARACYHMGNRHVPLQIGPGRMRFQPDHVLGAMLAALGLELATVQSPFDPEAGAYGAGHAHVHSHSLPGAPHPSPRRGGETEPADEPARRPRIHRMGEAQSGEA